MSILSEEARSAAKSKAERLVRADPTKRVDASGYRPDGPMDADSLTGMRPISRRQYRRGGKVDGETSSPRADRKPRAGAGFHEMKRAARASGGALTANSLINRDVKEANKERGGDQHIGGMNKGGAVHGSNCSCAKCSGGRVKRASGGPARAGHAAINDGTRPAGGRLARKGGGRAKGKTNINIVIAPQGSGAPQGAPPPGMPPGPPPAAGPVGMHQGPPPAPMGPAAPPPGAMPAPMMRKDGGRAGFSGQLAKPGKYPIETGGGGGVARLEKAQRAKRVES